jgi:hypothetical protein
MTQIRLHVQSRIIIERITQREIDIRRGNRTNKPKEGSGTHASDGDTIEECSFMPDSGHGSDDKGKPGEEGGDDERCSKPGGVVFDFLDCVDFGIDKDD